MKIQRKQLSILQHLQEIMAKEFINQYEVSGETYWTCIESLAFAKLAEIECKGKGKK